MCIVTTWIRESAWIGRCLTLTLYNMKIQKRYSDLVSQAEEAVSTVKDAELRRVAFEKILDDLLLSVGGAARPVAAPVTAHKGPHVPRHKTSSPPKAKRGPQRYVEELIGDKFFEKPKTIAEVKAELQNRGHHIPATSLSGPLQKLCQKKALRRQKTDGTFRYSEW